MKKRPPRCMARFAWTTCLTCKRGCLYLQHRYHRSFIERFALGILYSILIAVLMFLLVLGVSTIFGMLVPNNLLNGTFTFDLGPLKKGY